MNCYTAAAAELGVLIVVLVLVGAVDVWRNVWREQHNGHAVNTGKSPAPAARRPR